MSDAHLRQLEREAIQGDLETQARLLLERVRVGELTQERLELAAQCGHPAAREALGDSTSARMDEDSWVWDSAGALTVRERVAFACRCAERTLRVWEEHFPTDDRPRRAIEYLRRWISTGSVEYIPGELAESIDTTADEMTGGPAERTGVAGMVASDALRILSTDPEQPTTDLVMYAADKARATLPGPGELEDQKKTMARLLLYGVETQ